mmetsp:Transcript_105683/g.209984  ORF Transcript_105683/g.209984 Transcript_105683/m.209984 type:complete len:488 (+) Transcript_105683:66-1529(+)
MAGFCDRERGTDAKPELHQWSPISDVDDDIGAENDSIRTYDGKPKDPTASILSSPWRLVFDNTYSKTHSRIPTSARSDPSRQDSARQSTVASRSDHTKKLRPIDITEVRDFDTRQSSKQAHGDWRRDVCYFFLGCVAAVGAVHASHYVGSVGSSHADLDVLGEPCSAHASPAELHMPTSSTARIHNGSKPYGKYAFVQMAFDVPWKPPVHVWRVLPMARLLQSLSKFPLVLLTNTSHFPDGTNVTDAFRKLDVILLPCHRVPLSETWASKLPKRWLIPYWKLQIWRLTDFEKLIWLDADTILFRNMDWLFNYDGVWGQRDNWVCGINEDQQNWLCSGLLLIQPNEEIYQGLVNYAQTGADQWYTNGDQKLIRNYFEFVKHTPVKLLSTADASFGKCVGHTPGIPYHSFGPWNMPSFIHKSSIYNECFDHNPAVQLKKINGSTVNICHYHPLGPYWRNLFCEATNIAGVQTQLSASYCNDVRWYTNER